MWPVAAAAVPAVERLGDAPMSDPRQVVRQLDILRSLQSSRYGLTTEDLARQYGATVRTLQRDLGDLREAGFVISRRRRPDGRLCNHLEVAADVPFNVTIMEMAALLFMETLAEALAGTPFQSDLHTLSQRLLQALPEEQIAFLRRAAEVYAPHVRGRKPVSPQAARLLADLNRAVLEQQVCEVTYRSLEGGRTKTYNIEPLRLLYYLEAGGLYVVVRVPPHTDPVTLAFERIRDLQPQGDRFTVPPALASTVETRLRDTFGIIAGEPFEARVRFTPAQARYIRERVWHASQRLDDQPDGGVIVTLQAASPYEIRAWVLSHGAAAQVLAPAWLRQQVQTELATALAGYGGD
jgi:predicted DNA-binding transcriptional regulator YafY